MRFPISKVGQDCNLLPHHIHKTSFKLRHLGVLQISWLFSGGSTQLGPLVSPHHLQSPSHLWSGATGSSSKGIWSGQMHLTRSKSYQKENPQSELSKSIKILNFLGL